MPIIRDIVTLILIQGTFGPNPSVLKPPTIQLHVIKRKQRLRLATKARKDSTKVNTFAAIHNLEGSLMMSTNDHTTNHKGLAIIFKVQTSNSPSLRTPKPLNYLPSNFI